MTEFCGHGIGRAFHTAPNILHFRNSGDSGTMQVGHVFTIEPMICEGTRQVHHWSDPNPTPTPNHVPNPNPNPG